MFTLRKIGGLHWIKLGRIRIAWCIVRKRPSPMDSLRAVKADLQAVTLPTTAQLREYGFPGT